VRSKIAKKQLPQGGSRFFAFLRAPSQRRGWLALRWRHKLLKKFRGRPTSPNRRSGQKEKTKKMRTFKEDSEEDKAGGAKRRTPCSLAVPFYCLALTFSSRGVWGEAPSAPQGAPAPQRGRKSFVFLAALFFPRVAVFFSEIISYIFRKSKTSFSFPGSILGQG